MEDIVTFRDVGAMVLLHLVNIELQQLALINKRMCRYFNPMGTWEMLWKLIIQQPHPPCDMKTLRKTLLVNRIIMRLNVIKVKQSLPKEIKYPSTTELLAYGGFHVDFLYYYLIRMLCINEGEIRYAATRPQFDIRDNWEIVMHLLPSSKRSIIIRNTQLASIIRITPKDIGDIWDLVRYKLSSDTRIGSGELLDAAATAYDEGLDDMGEYLDNLVLAKKYDRNPSYHEQVGNLERCLEEALNRGWTVREWMRKNYMDMSAFSLGIIWKLRKEELIDGFISPLSIDKVGRLMSLCERVRDIEGIEELQYYLLRYLVDFPVLKAKQLRTLEYLIRMVDPSVIDEVYHDCIQLPHVSNHLALLEY